MESSRTAEGLLKWYFRLLGHGFQRPEQGMKSHASDGEQMEDIHSNVQFEHAAQSQGQGSVRYRLHYYERR
jgi:hypothetical protein